MTYGRFSFRVNDKRIRSYHTGCEFVSLVHKVRPEDFRCLPPTFQRNPVAILLYLPLPSNAFSKLERCTEAVYCVSDFTQWLRELTSIHAQERTLVNCSGPYIASSFPKETGSVNSLTVKLLHKFDRARWRDVIPRDWKRGTHMLMVPSDIYVSTRVVIFYEASPLGNIEQSCRALRV